MGNTPDSTLPEQIQSWYTLGDHQYFSESDYALPDWPQHYWPGTYERLLQIKHDVDPAGVFWCHHCVGDNTTAASSTAPGSTTVGPVGADITLLASSSIPAWCNDIPSDGQKYIAACGGGGESNSQGSNVGAVPSWCENIPAGSRANVPSCANRDGAPISSAPGLASSTGLVMTVIASFFSAVV